MNWHFLTSFNYYLSSTTHVALINEYILSCMCVWYISHVKKLSRSVSWLFVKTLRSRYSQKTQRRTKFEIDLFLNRSYKFLFCNILLINSRNFTLYKFILSFRMTSISMDTCFNTIDWLPRSLEFLRFHLVPLIQNRTTCITITVAQ